MTHFVVASGKIDERASFLASPFFPAKNVRPYQTNDTLCSTPAISLRISWVVGVQLLLVCPCGQRACSCSQSIEQSVKA